jgi:hypothetical protein
MKDWIFSRELKVHSFRASKPVIIALKVAAVDYLQHTFARRIFKQCFSEVFTRKNIIVHCNFLQVPVLLSGDHKTDKFS